MPHQTVPLLKSNKGHAGEGCLTLLAITLILFTSWGKFDYEGDGEFADTGPFVGTYERYRLELGRFRTDKSETRVFKVGALPEEKLLWGFEVKDVFADDVYNDDGDSYRYNKVRGLANVHLKIVDDQENSVVAEQKGSLSDWEWWDITQKSNPGGTPWRSSEGRRKISFLFSSENIRFAPQTNHTFTVTVEIAEPDETGLELLLKASGGLTWEVP